MSERTVKVYEVLYNGEGEGPAGDGTHTYRTRDKRKAEQFAARNTVWGSQSTVNTFDAPMRLVRRWGL